MAMETDQLVQCLVAQVEPVRRLSPPWRRSLVWLNLSLLYIAVVAGIHLVARGGGGGKGSPPGPGEGAPLANGGAAGGAAPFLRGRPRARAAPLGSRRSPPPPALR